MRALLSGGADPAIRLPDGTTSLMAAAGLKEGTGRDSDRRGLILIDGGKLPDEDRIVEAVSLALLQPAVDIDAGNRNGDTALHAASTMGYDQVVKLLAEKDANLNVKNSRGLTPLAALRGRNPSTAELLRKLGAVD